MSRFVEQLLFHAAALVGTHESSPNRGLMVDQIHRYAGRDPAQADSWCAQTMYWVFGHACADLGVSINPCPRTSSVMGLWQRSAQSSHMDEPAVGDVFCIDHGQGKGHCGLVVGVPADSDLIETIEGNTNPGGSRNGDGVYRRTRKLGEINLGYLRLAVQSQRQVV